MGFDIWEFQETVLGRIAQLKKDFEHKDSLYFNLIEILMLIDNYGEFIKISDDGEFIIKKLYLFNFINKLSYDIDVINSLHEIKREYLSVSNEIEIDAREIFFIMKNAKNFGLGNVENHVQFFQFINKNKSEIIIDDMSINLNDSNNIKIIVSDDIGDEFNQTSDGIIVKKTLTAKEELQNVINSYLTEIEKETLDNGYTKLTYLDGTIVIKNGPWEIVEVKTLEEIKKEEEELNEKKAKEEHKKVGEVANKVMATVSVEIEDKKTILEKELEENKSIKEDKHQEEVLTKNEQVARESESKFLLPMKNKNIYFMENGREKSYYSFFENISSDKDFDKAFRTLNKNNILILLGIFFNEDFFNVTFTDDNNLKKSVSLFVTDGRNFYLSYEFVIYVLLNLVKDKDVLLVEISQLCFQFLG